MNNWPEVALVDICEKPRYGAIASADDQPVGPRFVRQTDIVSGRIDWSSVPYASLPLEETSKYALREGDLLVSRLGAGVGNAARMDSTDGAVFAGYLVRFRVDPEKADDRFLGHVLQSRLWRSYVESVRSGGAQPTLNAKQMGAFRFALPPLEEQKRIADVLTAFDDLMETNRRLSSGLLSLLFAKYEALAGDRDTSAFGEVASLVRDQWKPGQEHPGTYLGLEHFAMDGAGLIRSGEADSVNSVSLKFQPGDVLYGKLRPYFRKVARPGFAGICSSEIWVLRAQAGYPQSLVHALAHMASFSEAAMAGSTGTRMPRADWKHISTMQVPALQISDLDPDVLDGLETLWAVACDLDQESTELSLQRDKLLPLLMSGKVRVRDLEAVA